MVDINKMMQENRKRTFELFSQDVKAQELEQLTIQRAVAFKKNFYENKPLTFNETSDTLKKQALKQIGYAPSLSD